MSRIKTIAAVLVGVLLVAACAALLVQSRNTKTATADFQRVTGLYTGSAVRMLGIQIGINVVSPEESAEMLKMAALTH